MFWTSHANCTRAAIPMLWKAIKRIFELLFTHEWRIKGAICYSNYTLLCFTYNQKNKGKNWTIMNTLHKRAHGASHSCTGTVMGSLHLTTHSIIFFIVPFLFFVLHLSLQYWVCSDYLNNWCSTQWALASTTNQLICTFWAGAHVPTSAESYSIFVPRKGETENNNNRSERTSSMIKEKSSQIQAGIPVQQRINMAITTNTASPFPHMSPFRSIFWCHCNHSCNKKVNECESKNADSHKAQWKCKSKFKESSTGSVMKLSSAR